MNAHDLLNNLERRAESAIAQELVVMTREVLALRPTLEPEDRAHASCLLLKLDHLHRNLQIDGEPCVRRLPQLKPTANSDLDALPEMRKVS